MDYDHVFFDVNNVIYSMVARSKSEEQFYLKLYKEMDGILKLVRPKQTMFLAVDGPGTRAK
jgi:5'-3' exonuclease